MARTSVALYDDLTMAQHVLNDLVRAGVPRENISLIANDAAGDYRRIATPAEHVGPGEGAATGATFGALTGLVVALGALVIPGIGPVIAAGPLVAGLTGALTGAVAGAATGGLVGGLLSLDVPPAEAGRYAEGVRRGGTLVAVRAPREQAALVEHILDRHNPADIDERAQYWRKAGWTYFNPADRPFLASDIARERQAFREWESDADTQPARAKSRVRSFDIPGENADQSARV
jgi:hypothetical protein